MFYCFGFVSRTFVSHCPLILHSLSLTISLHSLSDCILRSLCRRRRRCHHLVRPRAPGVARVAAASDCRSHPTLVIGAVLDRVASDARALARGTHGRATGEWLFGWRGWGQKNLAEIFPEILPYYCTPKFPLARMRRKPVLKIFVFFCSFSV